jgi:hypothetical protein
MFSDIGTVAAWVLGIIVMLTAAGVAWALVKGAYTKARMEALRTSLDDTDKELAKEKGRRLLLEARVKHVESENDTLKNLVLQRAEFDLINEAMETHENNAVARAEAMLSTMKEYFDTIMASVEGGKNANG